MTNPTAKRSAAQRNAMRTTTGIALPGQQPPRDGTEFYPPGTFTRVYAPQLDPVHRIWQWDWPMPEWAGLPESERKNGRGNTRFRSGDDGKRV